MTRRFFVETPITDQIATLAETEAHHLMHVLRATPGTEVTLFDGSGDEFRARVTTLGRTTVELEIVARETIDRELARQIHLAVALPKGDRQKWLVEKCVELGVAHLTPLQTDRSVAQPTGQAVGRLKRAVIEASKQCGRNRLMTVDEPVALADLASRAAGQGGQRWIADPGGEPVAGAFESLGPADVCVMIGPEGGFTKAEIELARQHDWQVVCLGPRLLRIETAAVAIAARLSTDP